MIHSSIVSLAFIVVAMTGGGSNTPPSAVCPAGQKAIPVYHKVGGKKKFWHYKCVTPKTASATAAPRTM